MSMKKIIVINSPVFEEKDNKNNEDYLPPLGIGIIFSSLAQYNIEFIDSIADDLSLTEISSKIISSIPDFILINIFTTNFLLVKKIVEQVNIKTHWIIGGISTKSLYQEIFKWDTQNQIDVVYGDGELIASDIINSSLKEPPFDQNTGRRYFVIGETSHYYVKNISNEKLNREIFKNEPQNNVYNELEISIYTSRGCPYNCAYCVAARSRNKELGNIRRKKTQRIIEELNDIRTNYPDVRAIRILDDLFLSNKKSFEEAVLIFEKFSFNWRAMCHIKSINSIEDDMLTKLKNCGCNELFIGIESGSPNILKAIHKTDNTVTILQSVKRVLKTSINVKGYFICGFPNETIDDLEKTYNLATELVDFAKKYDSNFRNSTFQFRPYFGTELYDKIAMNNGIPKNSILYNTKISSLINDNIRDKSFNFDSGNYSSVSDDVLNSYIKKLNKLNDGLI